MVNITTVYDSQSKSMRYVFINEEYLVVSSYDYIREELHGAMETDDFVLLEISQEEFTTEPSPEYIFKYEMDDDTASLLLDCMEAFIKNYVKHNGRNYLTTYDKLPNSLYSQLTEDYKTWLNNNSLLVETDGYKIILNDSYHTRLTVDTPNEKAAKDLQEHMAENISRLDGDDDECEEFYREKLQIIYCGKLFTFENGADVYNALTGFAELVIDNQ